MCDLGHESSLWELEADRARLAVARATGARWDDLALSAGSPVTVASWYYEWEKSGLWQEISRRAMVRGRHP